MNIDLELSVTKAVVKEYEPFGTYYPNGYKRRPLPEKHLCLTGEAAGQRYWVKLPTGVGLANGLPYVAPGDLVALKARVKSVTDDGSMTFLTHGKLGVVVDEYLLGCEGEVA